MHYFMHAAHVLHRDLAPQNIFLVDGSHVKVLDFAPALRAVCRVGRLAAAARRPPPLEEP